MTALTTTLNAYDDFEKLLKDPSLLDSGELFN